MTFVTPVVTLLRFGGLKKIPNGTDGRGDRLEFDQNVSIQNDASGLSLFHGLKPGTDTPTEKGSGTGQDHFRYIVNPDFTSEVSLGSNDP